MLQNRIYKEVHFHTKKRYEANPTQNPTTPFQIVLPFFYLQPKSRKTKTREKRESRSKTGLLGEKNPDDGFRGIY
jgi:hypothetical protein